VVSQPTISSEGPLASALNAEHFSFLLKPFWGFYGFLLAQG